MTDLDERFRSLARTPVPDLWKDMNGREPRHLHTAPKGGRIVAGVAAFFIAIAGLGIVVVAFREPVALDHPPASPVSDLRGEVAATVEVGEDPRSVVYGAGSVWVAVSNNDGSDGGRILRIDPVTNETIAEIPVETIPTWEVGGGAMLVEGDSLWVTGGVDAPGSFESPGGGSDTAVLRIDVTTNDVVDLFTVGGTVGADLAFLEGDLWVLLFGDGSVDNSMELVQVNAATAEVVTRIPLNSGWAHTLIEADGRLVTYEGGDRAVNVGGRLTLIDPATGAVTWTDLAPIGPIAWQNEVWAWADGRFAKFDISTGEVIDRSSELDPKRLSPRGLGLEADDRAIWFLGGNGLEGGGPVRLAAFDPAAAEVTELATLPEEGTPVAMAVAPDSVWVLNYEGTLTKVSLLPTETPVAGTEPRRVVDPRITATIPVGAFPRAVAVGEGAVWATVDNANGGPDDHLLVEIDTGTNQVVETTAVFDAGDVAVGHGAVWVVSGLDNVLRIDPSTGDVTASIRVGFNASNLAVDDVAVWVTTNTTLSGFATEGEVLRIDPELNEVVARVPISGGWTRDVVTGDGSVWVYGHSGYTPARGWHASSLWHIDPTTNQLGATVIDEEGFLGDGSYLPDNVAVGGGWVWAADHRGNGLRIDPATGASTRFQVTDDRNSPNGFGWPFVAYQGHVFFGLGRIRVLDTETFEVVASIPLESQVADAALDPTTGTLWVANYEGTVTRIDL